MIPAWSTTYYLDYTNGSDANDGLSPTTAWKNLQRIRTQGPQPGDVFLFKRGERWAGEQLYVTHSGSNGNPITYGAYGTATDPDPVITSVTALSGAWSSSGGDLWTLPLATTPGRLFLDGTEVLRASAAISEIGTPDTENAVPLWYHTGGTLYLHAPGNPASTYGTIEGSVLFYTALVDGADHIHFDGLDFQGGLGAALAIFGATEGVVRRCRLGRYGNSGLLLGDANFGGTITPTSAVLIEDNVFDSDFTFYYGTGSERGCGDGLRMIYGVEGCLVQNNTFRNWAHNAVELRADLAGRSGVHTNLIYKNTIEAPNIPYAHPFGADGLEGQCQNNEFSYNYIRDCRTASQINGNDNWVHHNIIVGMQRSPSKPQATAHAFILGIYGTGLVCHDNRFDHNLIATTDESGFLLRNYGYAATLENNLIRNNILYDTGRDPYANAYTAGTGIVIYDGAGMGGNSFLNNLLSGPTGTEPAVFLAGTGTYYSAEAFNDVPVMGENQIADNRSGDPRFTDFANGDFFPLDDSPAVNNGIATGLTTDFAGGPRVIGPAPDIGPFETDVVSALPVTWTYFRAAPKRDRAVALEWGTARERGSDRFIIERSRDGRTWLSRGSVAAAGSSDHPQTYAWVDEGVPVGTIYYRLRQLDRDGAVDFSPVRSVRITGEAAFTWTRFGAGRLRLRAMGTWDWATTRCTVFSLDGKPLGTTHGTPELDIAGLPAGIFLLRISRPGAEHWLRFRK